MATQDRPADPFSPALQRFTALAGIPFALLMIASIALSGDDTPAFDDPLEQWSTWAADNGDGTRYAALTFALATYCFVLFLGNLRSLLGRAEEAARGFTRASYFVIIGGTIGITGILLGLMVTALSAFRPDAPPEVVRAINDVGTGGFGIASPGFAVMLITVFLVNQAVRVLPSWLGAVALVTGVLFLLQLLTLLSEEGDNAFGFAYPLAFLGLVVFTIGTSLRMAKRVE
jgi:hypothetical protein